HRARTSRRRAERRRARAIPTTAWKASPAGAKYRGLRAAPSVREHTRGVSRVANNLTVSRVACDGLLPPITRSSLRSMAATLSASEGTFDVVVVGSGFGSLFFIE